MPYARNGSASLFFDVRGDGEETVVLIPGLGLPGVAWSTVTDRLERRYRVVVVDPRGSGASDKPDEPYTADLVATDLRSVLDATDTPAAHVIGLSMGGMIAQDFAVHFPARVRSLVLLSTFSAPNQWFTRLFEARRDLIEKVGIADHFRVFLMFVFSPFAFRDIPDTITHIEESLEQSPPDTSAYLRQIDYCLAHDASDQLEGIRAPTLVITGTHDFTTPPDLGRELAARVPNARFVEFEDASHGLWLEFSDKLVEVCERFFQTKLAP